MAKEIDAEATMFPLLMPLPATDIEKLCQKERLIEHKKGFCDSQSMFTNPIMKTKYATRKEIKRIIKKIRAYQIKKYFFDGIKKKGLVFIWDLIVFFLYYKPKYSLELDNAWKFTVNKYNIAKFH
jgi:hypothetical protein